MFGLTKSRPAVSSSQQFDHSSPSGAANSSKAAVDIQRELARVAFKDTMRVTGVPAQWLDCEVRCVPLPNGGEQLHIQLVIKKWSGHLLRYAVAFQHQFLQCLDRYDPSVDHSTYEWSWKFSADCDCPFPEMPPPEEWAAKLEASKAKAAPRAVVRPVAASPKPIKSASKPAPAEARSDKPQWQDSTMALRDIFADI